MSEVKAATGSKKMSGKDASLPQKDLTHLFKAKSVAIVGASASPDKIGHQILRNLIDGGFEGDIYPINPKEKRYSVKMFFPRFPMFLILLIWSLFRLTPSLLSLFSKNARRRVSRMWLLLHPDFRKWAIL
jgi:hypothetical protein